MTLLHPGQNERHTNEPSHTGPIQVGPRAGLAPVFCPGHGGIVYIDPEENGFRWVECGVCGDEVPVHVYGVEKR